MADVEEFSKQRIKTWHPARFTKEGYDSDVDLTDDGYSILVLNVPIENRDIFQTTWMGGT